MDNIKEYFNIGYKIGKAHQKMQDLTFKFDSETQRETDYPENFLDSIVNEMHEVLRLLEVFEDE